MKEAAEGIQAVTIVWPLYLFWLQEIINHKFDCYSDLNP